MIDDVITALWVLSLVNGIAILSVVLFWRLRVRSRNDEQ